MICELPTAAPIVTPTPPAPPSNGSAAPHPGISNPAIPNPRISDLESRILDPESAPLLSASAPHRAVPSPSVPSCLCASVPSSNLSPHDESLLLALLDADMSIATIAREQQTTLSALIRWSTQPHIRAALSALADLGALRAKAIAANHSAAAVRTLVSAAHLADADFYEQADPRDRIRSFESGRKAAAQLLRLAGCSAHMHPRPASARRPEVAAPTTDVQSDLRAPTNPKSAIQNPKPPPNRPTFNIRSKPRRRRPSRAQWPGPLPKARIQPSPRPARTQSRPSSRSHSVVIRPLDPAEPLAPEKISTKNPCIPTQAVVCSSERHLPQRGCV
jgi:hypothetical protein